MRSLFSTPLFGIMISIIAFEIGLFINRKTKLALLNPILICIVIIIAFLMKFNIPYEDYNKGGQIITFFLGPSTVILAVPLYKNLDTLKKNIVPILASITVGSITAMTVVILLSRLFNLPKEVAVSLIPKSITTPIGVELSKQLSGVPSITIVSIIITGIFGFMAGPAIYKIFKVNDKIAKGLGLGTSAHAFGTAKALEIGEEEGAMSGLSIGIAGIITVLLAPVLWAFFSRFFQ